MKPKPRRTLTLDEARGLVGHDVTSVARLHGAGISDVFAVDTATHSVVVKLFPPDYAWKLQKELSVYRMLDAHGLDLPIPRVLAVHGKEHVLVLERLAGLPADRITDADAPQLYRELGHLLARLHTIKLEAFGYLSADGVVDPHATNLDYMRSQFDKRLAAFHKLGGDESLGRSITEYVRRGEEVLVRPPTPVFCHNDCHEGNILVTRARGNMSVTAWFDFENALAGDPLLDLAKTVAYSPRDRSAVTDALADGYGALPSGWRDALALYGLYHVLELWTWFASLGEREHLDGLAQSLAERLE
jgi:hygromycin-B 7''-O-kinase